MRPDDIASVLEIERASQPSPWPAQLFLQELERDWAHVDLAWSASGHDGDAGSPAVVGFCNYWLVHDEVHLLNLATHPGWRRQGVATRLLRYLLDVGKERDCRFVTLEVRASNRPARDLYQRHGFEAVGLRPRYYAESGEDAVVMTLELETGEPRSG